MVKCVQHDFHSIQTAYLSSQYISFAGVGSWGLSLRLISNASGTNLFTRPLYSRINIVSCMNSFTSVTNNCVRHLCLVFQIRGFNKISLGFNFHILGRRGGERRGICSFLNNTRRLALIFVSLCIDWVSIRDGLVVSDSGKSQWRQSQLYAKDEWLCYKELSSPKSPPEW